MIKIKKTKNPKKYKNMEIVKQISNSTTTNSSSKKDVVAGNIYWKYDKATKTGKLLLKKGNETYETYEVNNLNVTLNVMYLFVKDKDKIFMSLLCRENETNELYFISLPSYVFVDIYNNNPVKMLIMNNDGKLQIEYLESAYKAQKISDSDRKYFNILNYLANADNSELIFKIKIFIK